MKDENCWTLTGKVKKRPTLSYTRMKNQPVTCFFLDVTSHQGKDQVFEVHKVGDYVSKVKVGDCIRLTGHLDMYNQYLQVRADELEVIELEKTGQMLQQALPLGDADRQQWI